MKKVFSAKKFICGAATVLQIWPSGYSHYRRAYPHTSEVEALRGDWEKIGKDMNKPLNEPLLRDDHPVYYGYTYLLDGEPVMSDIGGTVARLKELTGANEVRKCDVMGRGLNKW